MTLTLMSVLAYTKIGASAFAREHSLFFRTQKPAAHVRSERRPACEHS
jgi:hypothetical protein